MNKLEELRKKYLYPNDINDVNAKFPSYFMRRHRWILSKFINNNTKLIVEIGSWVGGSANWICKQANNAILICIDHWIGSTEHFDKINHLNLLYNKFLYNTRIYKDRIIPLKMNSIDGLSEIAKYGIEDDIEVVYIDGSHEYDDVLMDIQLSYTLFRNAVIIGDDYNWKNENGIRSVKEAVKNFTNKNNITYQTGFGLWYINVK